MLTNNEISSGERKGSCQGVGTDESDSVRWVDVARVANLAEAGFIVDELVGMNFQACLHQVDEFRAATDRWSAQYLIRVAEGSASAAADHIRQYLTEESPGQRTMLTRLRESIEVPPQERYSSWRPVLAVVLVGVTSFLLGHQTSEPAAARRATSTDLATAIANTGRTFSSEPAANQPNYRLSFERRTQLWTLRTDRDHDGIYESERCFTATGAAR